jgi:2,3-bisphosphoglycerate-independent phosphoglycerate mutase
MSAHELAQEAVRRIKSGRYDFIVLNFANGDMVGHTGNMDAAVKAVEAVDNNLGLVLDGIYDSGGAFVTSDHGNAETMLDNGSACTAHSCSSVPFINATEEKRRLRNGGTLGDIAPTILEILRLPKPTEMTGASLFLPIEIGRR